MLYDPNSEPGQGARLRCANRLCGKPLSKHGTGHKTGRRQLFCSDRCRKEAARHPVLLQDQGRNFSEPPHPPQGLSESWQKRSTKSAACKAGLASPRSLFTPALQVVAGPAVSLANLTIPYRGLVAKTLDPAEREELIRLAIELEFAARWLRGGGR